MALLGHLISRSLEIRKHFSLKVGTPRSYQIQELTRLLRKAKHTHFGKHYDFTSIKNAQDIYEEYKKVVPFHNYNQMYSRWWKHCQEGEANVAWPGKVKYFALSSGTSESASKHIPVTDAMIKSVKRAGIKQMFTLQNFNVSTAAYDKGLLMLGGTTSLFEKGDYYEGDMSGISAKKMPRWVSYFYYKPGRHISKRPKWEDRIKLIVRKAPTWNVGTVCGVPAWVQIVFEQIIAYHKVNNIHDIWPNLTLYIHGGVSFEPYKDNFKKLLGKPISFIETYMASEGSFGFQTRPGTPGIKLLLNNGIFFEFVPFNEDNFNDEGEVKAGANAYLINETVEGKEYAVVLSTCSGAWRYIIGDVVKFTNVKLGEIVIVGRTKQFLSLCGEHLSVDNMNKAIDIVQRELGINITEFSVAGKNHEGLFAHQWYLGCDATIINTEEIKACLDNALCTLNDDYAVERTSALKDIFVQVLPSEKFIDFFHHTGKYGAMNKFPRVLKGVTLEQWEEFIK